jgi:hypothetical protein
VKLENNVVVLEKAGGGQLGIALSRLSREDQEAARRLAVGLEADPVEYDSSVINPEGLARSVEQFIAKASRGGVYPFFDREGRTRLNLELSQVLRPDLMSTGRGQFVVPARFTNDQGSAYVLDFYVLCRTPTSMIVLPPKTSIRQAAGEPRYQWVEQRKGRWKQEPL